MERNRAPQLDPMMIPSPNWKVGVPTSANGTPRSGFKGVAPNFGRAGIDGCNHRDSVETTMANWMDPPNHKDVFAYFSIWASCHGTPISIGKWESVIKSVVSKVESKMSSKSRVDRFRRHFGGVDLDEENGFGYTPAQLTTLNLDIATYLRNLTESLGGRSISEYTVLAPGGNEPWTLSQMHNMNGSNIHSIRPGIEDKQYDNVALMNKLCSKKGSCEGVLGVFTVNDSRCKSQNPYGSVSCYATHSIADSHLHTMSPPYVAKWSQSYSTLPYIWERFSNYG